MKNLSYKYLVIEDDTNVWGNIEQRMNNFPKWEACGFTDEIDYAFSKISVYKPQLIFSDWSIKGGNAFQILELIKSMEHYEPYIIFFTGYQSDYPYIPEKIFNDYPFVKKYIVKPIFENLTEHLAEYVQETEKWHLKMLNKQSIFIETVMKQKLKILPKDCVAILQSEENPRIKKLFLENREILDIRYTWEEILGFLDNFGIEYFITHNRKSVINKTYITKISRPYIWLCNDIRVEVAREKWGKLASNKTKLYKK